MMSGRSRWWRVGAIVFVVGNVAGAIYHIVIGEMGAAMGHSGVAAGTVLLWQTVFSRKREDEVTSTADTQEIDSHLDHLERSVDAIAIEVERLGEGQRFAQKILEARRVGEEESQGSSSGSASRP